MKGLGLVFAGGGGKGAYEIGIWKYLHETGLEQYVRAVSGTSVGALNAALFIGSTYEMAESVWLNISKSKILSPKKVTMDDVVSFIKSEGLFAVINTLYQNPIEAMISAGMHGLENLSFAYLKFIHSDSFFSRDGLIDIINKGVDFYRIAHSDIPCFVTCLKYPGFTINRFIINNYVQKDIITLLLASSAIPMVFPKEEFEGDKYCDGGVPLIGDNIPIEPIYNEGIEYILVVHLTQDTIIDKNKYPNSKIIEIIPSKDLGNALTGTMDFTSAGSQKRIDLGYNDAKKALQPFIDMLVLKEERKEIFTLIKNSNLQFEKEKNKLMNKNLMNKKALKVNGFDDMMDDLLKGE